MIHVRNKRTFKGPGTYVGRGSFFGNPFSHVPSKIAEFRVETRDEAVDRYEPWLRDKLLNEGTVRQAFDLLVETYIAYGVLTLICWCAPERCHAEVIAKLIEEAVCARTPCHEHQEQGQTVETSGCGENGT